MTLYVVEPTDTPLVGKVNKDAVERLEKHLEAAKKGELTSFVLIGVRGDINNTFNDWSESRHNQRTSLTLLGALELAREDFKRAVFYVDKQNG